MTSPLPPSAYVPWQWTLVSKATPPSCPSMSRVLGTYAVAATIISLVVLFAGHRGVVHFFTCHCLGTKDSRAWRGTWVFPLVLSLSAAAINALIIERDPARDSSYPMHDLFFVQLTLPRMSFCCLLIVYWCQMRWTRNSEESGDSSKNTIIGNLGHGSAAAAASIAEILIQIPIMYWEGKIAYFVFSNGYYVGNPNYDHVPKGARMMYAASLFHLLADCAAILMIIIVGTISATSESKQSRLTLLICWCLILGMLTFAADWVFWAGFLDLTGNTYCVPQLELQAAIRIIFAAVGALFGGSW